MWRDDAKQPAAAAISASLSPSQYRSTMAPRRLASRTSSG